MRLAYWTGIRRWDCSTNTTSATTTRPTRETIVKVAQPRVCWMAHSALGNVAMIWVKISSDMPLPMPRSVMSSPSHMITAVPAVMVMTMTAMTPADSSGMISSGQFWNSPPLRASETIVVACSTASPMVRYLVYWVILVWPAWPSFLRASRRGITTVSNCRMMLAVMYVMMPSVNTIFLRRSGVRNARANAVSTSRPPAHRPNGGAVVRTGQPERPAVTCSVTITVRYDRRRKASPHPRCGGRTEQTPVVIGPSGSELVGRAAGGGDLLLRRAGERVCAHLQGGGDLTGAQDLDRAARAYRALRHQVLDGHVAAFRVQRRQLVQVDDLELDPERVAEAFELGEPHVQRHLPAFEAGRNGATSFAALRPATGGLAACSGLTPADPGLGGLRARCGSQVVRLEGGGSHVNPP